MYIDIDDLKEYSDKYERFLKLIKLLDEYEIYYELGNMFNKKDEIIGYWLKIEEQEIYKYD